MAVTKTIVIKADTSDAVKSIDDVTGSLEGAEKQAKDTGDTVEEVGKSAAKSKKGFKSMASGVKAVGTALKAAGIGLVIAVIAGLTEAFSRNKKVMDALGVVMGTIQEVFSQITGALIDTYNAVAKSSDNFDALGKVLGGILTIVLTPLKATFYGIVLAVQTAQLAWEKSFLGGQDAEKIKELNISILETKANLVEVAEKALKAGGDIINNFSEAVGEVGNIGSIAIENLSKVNIATATETAKAYQKATQSAQIAAAINRGVLEQYDRQAELLRQIRDDESASIEDRIAANKELGEVLNEQEKAMLKNADLVIAGAQAELLLNDSIDNQVALIEARNEKLAIQAQIEGFRSEQLVNTNGLLREKNEIEQAAIDLITEKEEREKAAADKKKTEDDKRAAEEIATAKMVQDAKINMTIGTLDRISQLSESNSLLGKATAASAALINTYQGITAELATKTVTPFEFGLKIANIATTAAIGFKAVKNILSTNTKTSSSGGGQSSGGGGASAPSFNLVAGSGSNQIAEGLKSQDQPVKAFVVSSDVSSGQSLDRNIVANSSL